jgi:SAM-dependent methyltransferase
VEKGSAVLAWAEAWEAAFERCALAYSENVAPILAVSAEGALEGASITGGARVLDIACGPGAVTRAAAQRVGAAGLVVGIDTSPTILRTPAAAFARAGFSEAPVRGPPKRTQRKSVPPAKAPGKADHILSEKELILRRVPGRDARCCFGGGKRLRNTTKAPMSNRYPMITLIFDIRISDIRLFDGENPVPAVRVHESPRGPARPRPELRERRGGGMRWHRSTGTRTDRRIM